VKRCIVKITGFAKQPTGSRRNMGRRVGRGCAAASGAKSKPPAAPNSGRLNSNANRRGQQHTQRERYGNQTSNTSARRPQDQLPDIDWKRYAADDNYHKRTMREMCERRNGQQKNSRPSPT
jgi:hypothetical protein